MRNHFDGKVAERYDESHAEMFEPGFVDPVVDFIAEECRGGAVLEFGVGTGRIALPLARRGVDVSGIELSPAMVDRLLAKPGGHAIDVTIGDFADTRAEGSYSVVYLVFNTIMNLTSQARQVVCFENAAQHLEPGGLFIVEVVVPALRRLPPGSRHIVFRSEWPTWGIDEYDIATQSVTSHHLRQVGDGVERMSIPFRYVWPAELDLMAELADMRLRDRYAGWCRQPFDDESTQHVSVWEKEAHREPERAQK